MTTARRPVTLCLALLAPLVWGWTAAQTSPLQTGQPQVGQAPVPPLHTTLPMLSTPATEAEALALARGRTLVQDFYRVRLEGLWQAFSEDLQTGWGSPGALRAFREEGLQRYGEEQEVLRERTFTDGGVAYYVRSARFRGDPGTLWNVVIGFDPGGRVTVFGFTPEGEELPGETAGSPSTAQ